MNWYYMDGDQQLGPVGDDVIKILVASGKLGLGSLVRSEGMADWWTVNQPMLDRISGSGPAEIAREPRCPQGSSMPPRDWEGTVRCPQSLTRLRIGAVCVDLALIFLLGAGWSRLMVSEYFREPWHFTWIPGWAAFSLLWLGFCMAKGGGASPGQLLLGVGVARGNGKAIGLPLLAVRWLASWGAAFFPILLFLASVGGIFFGDADPMTAKRFGMVAGALLVLAAPLLFTRGRRSLQDLVSGCAASANPGTAMPGVRKAAACVLVLAAVAAQGYDIWKGYVGGMFVSKEGRFSVWFPSAPEVSQSDGLVRASAVAGNPRVMFSVAYSVLGEGACVDIDKAVAKSAEGGRQIYWSEDLARESALGRRWRMIVPDGELQGIDHEECMIWVTGDRVYWLTILGPHKHLQRTVNRMFAQSFRFLVTSPARLAPPKAEVPYTPPPYSDPF